MEEIWKPVIGYDWYYEVSSLWNVKSTYFWKGKILSPAIRNWYKQVCFCIKWKKKTIYVHIIVAQAFIPNPDHKPQVNHIDGDKFNNNDWNLEWCNASYNIKHAYKTGLNKVSEFAILKIKERFNKKVINTETGIIYDSIKDAALSNNLNPKTLSGILRGMSKNKTNLIFYIKTGELPEF